MKMKTFAFFFSNFGDQNWERKSAIGLFIKNESFYKEKEKKLKLLFGF